MDHKDHSIIAQAAMHAATRLFAGTKDVDGALEAYRSIHADIYAAIESKGGDTAAPPPAPAPVQAAPAQQAPQTMQQAVNNVQAAFPGSQVVASPLSDDVDERWKSMFENPNDWYDNRGDAKASMNGGNGPDFRHKTAKRNQGDKYNIGLFLMDRKYGKHAPDWVWQQLGMNPPGQAPAQPAPVALALAPPVPFEAPF